MPERCPSCGLLDYERIASHYPGKYDCRMAARMADLRERGLVATSAALDRILDSAGVPLVHGPKSIYKGSAVWCRWAPRWVTLFIDFIYARESARREKMLSKEALKGNQPKTTDRRLRVSAPARRAGAMALRRLLAGRTPEQCEALWRLGGAAVLVQEVELLRGHEKKKKNRLPKTGGVS